MAGAQALDQAAARVMVDAIPPDNELVVDGVLLGLLDRPDVRLDPLADPLSHLTRVVFQLSARICKEGGSRGLFYRCCGRAIIADG